MNGLKRFGRTAHANRRSFIYSIDKRRGNCHRRRRGSLFRLKEEPRAPLSETVLSVFSVPPSPAESDKLALQSVGEGRRASTDPCDASGYRRGSELRFSLQPCRLTGVQVSPPACRPSTLLHRNQQSLESFRQFSTRVHDWRAHSLGTPACGCAIDCHSNG